MTQKEKIDYFGSIENTEEMGFYQAVRKLTYEDSFIQNSVCFKERGLRAWEIAQQEYKNYATIVPESILEYYKPWHWK